MRSQQRPLLQFIGLVLVILVVPLMGTKSARLANAQAVINLTTCQYITQPGSYRLMNNVSSTDTCFSVRGNISGVIFNGNNKTITTTTGDAFEVFQYIEGSTDTGTPTNVLVKNFTSATSGVRVYGDLIHHVTFQHLSVNGMVSNGGDDVTFDSNTVADGGIQANYGDNAAWTVYRPIISNNTVVASASGQTKALIEVAGDADHPCPRVDAQIFNNDVTNFRNDFPPPDITNSLRIRCATHSQVHDNVFHSRGSTRAMYLRDESDDGVYERNVFWSENMGAILIGGGNLDKTLPSRNIFRNNTFRSENLVPAWFDPNRSYTLYTSGVGQDNQFLYNTFYSNGGPIFGYIGAIGHTTFDHNTFYTSGTNNEFISLQGNNTNGPPHDSFTNNIFVYNSSNIFSYDQWRPSRYSGDYNIFYNRGGSVSFGDWGANLAAWRSSVSADAHSQVANPLLNNPDGDDFSLAATSPALGAASDGTNIGAWQTASCSENWSCGGWSLCSNSSQSRTCTDTNNCGTTTNRPPLTQSCDSTAPSVSVTAPTNGSTVFGTVAFSATATDYAGIAGVTFYVNGAALWPEDTSAPYSVDWNASIHTVGSTKTLTAVARDTSGNTTTSSSISVTINPPICTENWSCTEFSTCTDGSQSRTCTDGNNCGTTNSRPPLTQSCVMLDNTAPATVQNLGAQ